MSGHGKELLGGAALAALGATGFGLAGLGPLAGVLGGAGAAGAAGAGGAGLLSMGEGSALGMPLMGTVASTMPETAMLAAPQMGVASQGLLGSLGSMMSSPMGQKLGMQAGMSMLSPQQAPQQQNVIPPHASVDQRPIQFANYEDPRKRQYQPLGGYLG